VVVTGVVSAIPSGSGDIRMSGPVGLTGMPGRKSRLGVMQDRGAAFGLLPGFLPAQSGQVQVWKISLPSRSKQL
jgi:hypothetical protein